MRILELRQRLLLKAILAGGIFASCGCSKQQPGILAEIRARGSVVVATEAAYEPFEFVQDGKIVGYNKDVLDHVVAELNVQLVQVDLPFQGILPGLLARKFDFVATSVAINPERASKFAFTRPLGSFQEVIIVRANDQRIDDPADLEGRTVATQLSSSAQPPLEKLNDALKAKGGKGFADLKLFTSFPQTHVALAAGQADAIVVGSASAAALVRRFPETFRIAAPLGSSESYMAWVTRPEDQELRDFINARIDVMRESGELRRLQLKWLGFELKTPRDGYLPAGAR